MFARSVAIFFSGLTVAAAVHAQALPSATGGGLNIQVGAGVSIAEPDYGDKNVKGVSFFGNVDLPIGLGLDVEYHDTNIVTPLDLGESSFMGGLRYGHLTHRFYPYGKVLAGVGTLSFQQGYYVTSSSSTHGAYAFGGGLDYRLKRHIVIRPIDVEYQKWTYQPNGLTPLVFTFGVAYRFGTDVVTYRSR